MLTVEEEGGVDRTEGSRGRIPIESDGTPCCVERGLSLAAAPWTLDQDSAGRA